MGMLSVLCAHIPKYHFFEVVVVFFWWHLYCLLRPLVLFHKLMKLQVFCLYQ